MPIYPDPSETIPYVLKEDRELPESEQVVFYFKPQTMANVDRLSRLEDHSDVDVVLESLDRWENFRTREGNEIPFNPDRVRKELYAGWVSELALNVARISRVLPPEAKN